MLMSNSTALSDRLEIDFLQRRQLSTAAVRAVRGMRQLEREVQELCRSLAAKPAIARQHDAAASEEIARLLSKLLLFRMGLPDGAGAHAIQDWAKTDVSPKNDRG